MSFFCSLPLCKNDQSVHSTECVTDFTATFFKTYICDIRRHYLCLFSLHPKIVSHWFPHFLDLARAVKLDVSVVRAKSVADAGQ